jgi:hypothetical protein
LLALRFGSYGGAMDTGWLIVCAAFVLTALALWATAVRG